MSKHIRSSCRLRNRWPPVQLRVPLPGPAPAPESGWGPQRRKTAILGAAVSKAVWVILLALTVGTSSLAAQQAETLSERRLFLAETAGATLGSTAGLVLGGYSGYLITRALPCDQMRCGPVILGGLLAGSTILAATGSYMGSWQVGGKTSVGGALLGATVGLLAGYKVGAVLEDRGLPLSVVALAFPVTQGAMTAMGSRMAIRISW